ncbi:MAG: helix-turn-helix transcriptional regulator [Cyanobacteria bacterium J06555_12]
MTAFSEQLRKIRQERKITQTRLAELLGISQRVYTRWENGNAKPHFDSLVKLAELLNVSLDELAGLHPTSSEARIHNPELHRLCLKVDQLPDEDQRALVIVLDGLIKRSGLKQLAAE